MILTENYKKTGYNILYDDHAQQKLVTTHILTVKLSIKNQNQETSKLNNTIFNKAHNSLQISIGGEPAKAAEMSCSAFYNFITSSYNTRWREPTPFVDKI